MLDSQFIVPGMEVSVIGALLAAFVIGIIDLCANDYTVSV